MLALLSTRRANVAPTASLVDEVERLPDAVLEQGESAGLDVLDEPALLVLDRGLQQDARDFGRLGDFEGFEHDVVGRAALPSASTTSTAISRRSNGFSSTHSTAYGGLLDGAEQLPIDEEPHLSRRGRWQCIAPARRSAPP